MVDSRGYEILSAEEVEELKKVSPLFDIKLRSRFARLSRIHGDHCHRHGAAPTLPTARCQADNGPLP